MKAKLNYWVDVGIATTFGLSTVSGLVFLLPVSGSTGVLGLSFSTWDTLHLWSSLGLMAGVLGHLVLHARWIASMTKRTLLRGHAQQPAGASPAGSLTRRRFLSGAAALAATGAVAAALAAVATGRTDEDEAADISSGEASAAQESTLGATDQAQTELEGGDDTAADVPVAATQAVSAVEPEIGTSDSSAVEQAQEVPQSQGVACQKGQVNDPYPGRCRRYTDRDGDGICDYSVPGSGLS